MSITRLHCSTCGAKINDGDCNWEDGEFICPCCGEIECIVTDEEMEECERGWQEHAEFNGND